MKRGIIAIMLGVFTNVVSMAQWDTLSLPYRALTIEDGLSQGMVNSITQDRFGFLWFATKDGLNRYDGYGFKVYRNDSEDPTSVAENYIGPIHEGSDGDLWVGTASKGLDVFDRKREVFHHVDLGEAGNRSYIISLAQDHDGAVWAGTTEGLFKVKRTSGDGEELRFSVRRYFSDQNRVICDRAGHIWGYLRAEFSFRITPSASGPDRIDTLDMHRLVDGPWTVDRNTHINGVFVEDPRSGRVFGVYPYFIAEYDTVSLVPTIIHHVPYPNGQRLETDECFIDDHGDLWLGCNYLWRFNVDSHSMTLVRSIDPNLGNMAQNVSCTFRDRHGLVWMGTLGYGVLTYDPHIERFHSKLDGSVYWMQATPDDRMICLRPGTFLRVFDPKTRKYVVDRSDSYVMEFLPGLVHEARAAVKDREGIYWICREDLLRYDPVREEIREFPITNEKGEPIDRIKSIFPLHEEGDEVLWFGSDSAFNRFDKQTHAFRSFRYPIVPVHIPYHFAQAIHEDASGVFWIGTIKGLLRLDPSTGEWKHFQNDPADPSSLSFDLIFSILPDPKDPQNILWIGTNGGGLNRFDKRTGQCERFAQKDGLPNDVVYGILNDDAGNLWMSTNKGIARFNPEARTFRNYDAGDGLQGDEFNRNAFCKLKDGRLFFGGINGFNDFLPSELIEDPQPAEVVITDIKLVNRSIRFNGDDAPLGAPVILSSHVQVPYSANMVTFEFATMEFSAPRSRRYQYMLAGFDDDWIDAGTNNAAVYTNLDPGDYTFKVRGANRDDVWSDRVASFTLTVRPPWYGTWWFYAICILLLGGGILLYTLNLRWQRDRLERTVRVRTTELVREKDRSDELLRNILPAEVASELKAIGHAEAKHFEQVSILFSDFEGFTRISEQLSPAELLEELNVCFKAFDRIMEKHGVEKIKTIGDAYMAAGGVPDPTTGPPGAVVRAGLEMQRIMAERKVERDAIGRPSFAMRLGIHTGPVVAGIVGLKKFAYDMWGDTVNIASRMESSGEVGRVNISEATYNLVKNEVDLDFTPRGMVQAKGKGELRMYFVDHLDDGSQPWTEPLQRASSTNGQRDQERIASVELRDLRILIVEDNDFNAMVAQDELMELIPGALVDVAKNGRIAVDMVKTDPYDVVLMDVQMPEMNGYEATRAIRALPGKRARVAIIAMTANTMQAEVDRCKEAGMDGFVPKPFKREELIASMCVVIEARGAV